MKPYIPKDIEKKWRDKWEKEKTFSVDLDAAKKPYFNLMMFPYPSGEGLHVGHVYAFGGADTFGHFKKMQGYDLFEPMGFDSFGIHSENYALKVGKHPKQLIAETTKYFREEQLKKLGALFDWDRSVTTSDPEYYRWTQWVFTELFKAGLAVRKKAPVEWCPSCLTVLANEQVINGKCERCGTEVVQKELEQWFFKITEYAERLLKNLDTIDWSETTKTMQRNWIGRSEATEIDFALKESDEKVKIVTTRPDTIFGSTFVVIAPEHPLIEKLKDRIKNWTEVESYIGKARSRTDFERGLLNKDKTGVKIEGLTAINPVNNKEIPLYIADFVLITYGTGAIMAVPAHDERDFEFAKKFSLPVIPVIEKPVVQDSAAAFLYDEDNSDLANKLRKISKPMEYITPTVRIYYFNKKETETVIESLKEARVGNEEDYKKILEGVEFTLEVDGTLTYASVYMEDGMHVNSEFLNGLNNKEAIEKMNAWILEKKLGQPVVNFHLRDWLISRQRYWGPPIPMIYCESCAKDGKSWFTSEETQKIKEDKELEAEVAGWYPVGAAELPVLLPEVDDYQPRGSGVSPLASVPAFVNVKCPECGKDAKRETDVSDTFLDSSWYFLRYPSTEFTDEAFNPERTKKWLPVDSYIGGNEHAVLHLLYSRFVTMVFHDLGYLDFEEPYKKFRAHGLITYKGAKMSKSRGNVVNPNEYMDSYGSDTTRMYLLFVGPYDQGGDFSDRAIAGMFRFLNRVWNLVGEVKEAKNVKTSEKLNKKLQALIKKVGEDVEDLKFNTAIAALMEFVNEAYKEKNGVTIELLKSFDLLLAPFAPFISEEIWVELSGEFSVHAQKWPAFDSSALAEKYVTVVVAVNGKVRDRLEVESGASEEEVRRLAVDREKIQAYIEGKKVKKSIYIEGKILNLVV